jgi:hypothetical protein
MCSAQSGEANRGGGLGEGAAARALGAAARLGKGVELRRWLQDDGMHGIDNKRRRRVPHLLARLWMCFMAARGQRRRRKPEAAAARVSVAAAHGVRAARARIGEVRGGGVL